MVKFVVISVPSATYGFAATFPRKNKNITMHVKGDLNGENRRNKKYGPNSI